MKTLQGRNLKKKTNFPVVSTVLLFHFNY